MLVCGIRDHSHVVGKTLLLLLGLLGNGSGLLEVDGGFGRHFWGVKRGVKRAEEGRIEIRYRKKLSLSRLELELSVGIASAQCGDPDDVMVVSVARWRLSWWRLFGGGRLWCIQPRAGLGYRRRRRQGGGP